MPKNPLDGAYGTPKTAQEYREASKAGIWRFDGELEHLAHVQRTRPADFDRLGPQQRLRLGMYLDAKQAAADYGVDTTSEGNAA